MRVSQVVSTALASVLITKSEQSPGYDKNCSEWREMIKNQIMQNIAVLIWDKPKKLEQLQKVGEITFTCTSDDYIYITAELYHNNLVRYLITGTRSCMTVTADPITRQILRKPRNLKPWAVTKTECWASDIRIIAEEIQEHHKRLEV